ncbi:MAG: hypothetical protein N2450_07200 [bacterium]|nr:hypothetical protein [bacterium]
MSDTISYNQWPPGSALVIRRLAHDLMAPLTVLAGNLQLFALRNDLPEGMHQKIDELYEQTNVLVNLIRKTSSYAGEKAWTKNSGEIWERFQEGGYFAGSILARNGVQLEIIEPKCTLSLIGETQFWTEWFASLLASMAAFMEPHSTISLKDALNGFQLIASNVNVSIPLFEDWKSLIVKPNLIHPNPAVRVYTLGLMIANLKCELEIQNDQLTLIYVTIAD